MSEQRNKDYRAMIHFYILWDEDLNINHLRFYGQIEQMESNPNPNIIPSFSYQWIADQLNVNRRKAIKIANLLKQKGYIEHIKNSKGQWYWRTKKAQVIHDNTNCSSPASVPEGHPPSVPQGHPKDPKDININTSEQSSPAVSTFFDSTPLDLITVFKEELPDNPQPLVNVINKSLEPKVRKALKDFKTYWHARTGEPLTEKGFRAYLKGLKNNCPGFVNNKYINKGGKTQKNGIMVFLKWQTLEGYLNKTIF